MSISNQSHSLRWRYFEKAIELVIQRCAKKWSFEDFSDCFPLYVQRDRNGAFGHYTTISDFIEKQITKAFEATCMEQYNLPESIDILDRVYLDAKERDKSGQAADRKDVWHQDISPRGALCARTVPRLQRERDRLKASLSEMQEGNRRIGSKLQENIRARDQADNACRALLDRLTKMLEQWEKIQMDDLIQWAIEVEASLPNAQRG